MNRTPVRLANLLFCLTLTAFPPVFSQDEGEASATKKKSVTLEKLPPYSGSFRYRGFDWDKISQSVKSDPKMKEIYDKTLSAAKKTAAQGIVIRPATFSEVPTNSYAPGWERRGKNAPTFILAKVSDNQTSWLSREFVEVAVAARLSGDPELMDFVVKELKEVTEHWHPFQLPGWTLATDSSKLSPDGDGVWLATGWGIAGLVGVLDALGDRLPPEILTATLGLIKKEVALILMNWEKQIPWYVKKQAYESNQWAFPLVGLLMGTMALGEEKYRSAYELAALGLAKTCLSQGDDGSWVEGLSYSMITTGVLLQGILAMKRAGDDRLAHFPFVKNYGSWVGQMHLPGGYLINAFDSGFVKFGTSANRVLVWAALASEENGPAWVIENLYPELPDNWATWILMDEKKKRGGSDKAREKLPLWASFPDSAMAVWRSGWDPDRDWAVWMRGGSPNDFHSHRDQGHLSIQNGKDPVFVEMGVAGGYGSYHATRAAATGHNVLQSAGARPVKDQGIVAPMKISKMNEGGGEIEISASESYTDVASWTRKIVWTSERRVEVEDRAAMKAARKGGEEWFRWITGTPDKIEIVQKEKNLVTATWPAAEVTFKADRAIKVETMEYPSAVLDLKPAKILLVKVSDPGESLQLKTEVRLPDVKK